MEKYVRQLISDIRYATKNVPVPWIENNSYGLEEWKSEEEDLLSAPRKALEEWTDIQKIELPPAEMLNDDQIHRLLNALLKMLKAYNCVVIFQNEVPERYQYRVIRERFHQESSFLKFHINFFEFCDPGQEFKSCALGEYCQCNYMHDLFSRFSTEEFDDEKQVDSYEVHMRLKYGENWRRYDPNCSPGEE